MVLLELFWSFCKIGFTSFGGLSMIPTINHEMISHGWMSASQVSDIVAIAEMTPGPVGLNCATFAGSRVAGIPGALCASAGVLVPTLLLCAIVAVAFERFRTSSVMQKALTGIRPCCLGLILGVVFTMASNYTTAAGGISLAAIGIGVLALLALLVGKLSVPKTIFLSALLGLLLVR